MATPPFSLLVLFFPLFFSFSIAADGLTLSSIVQNTCSSTREPYSAAISSTLPSHEMPTTGKGNDSIKAAIGSIADCRKKNVKLSKFLDKLQKTAHEKYDIMALQDCHSLLLDSKDRMGDSIKELKQYRKDKNVEHVRNVQTWLSGAGTNVGTCSDGLDEGASDGLKKVIGSRINDVANLMSVSLGLVNQLNG